MPQPDLVTFLTISPEEARERGGYGEERYENPVIQDRVKELFGSLFKRVTGDIQYIDASGTVDAVEAEMLRVAKFKIDSLVRSVGADANLPRLGPLQPRRRCLERQYLDSPDAV